MEDSLVLTGMGLITCLGRGLEENWRALAAGAAGMRPLASIDVSDSPVKDGGEALPAKGGSPSGEGRVLAALDETCREAFRHARIASEKVPDPEGAALVLGSSLADSSSSPSFWKAFIEQGEATADYASLRSYDVEPLLDALCEAFDVRGKAVLVSNACAAGASSIALGSDLLRLGRADFVIAGGHDTLELHTFAGFGALGALSPAPMAPFSVHRAGMKLSDGFAIVLIEREEDARSAGRRPLARLLGHGESADAHHLTQPDPEGRGAAAAMRRALRMAGLEPRDVDHINLHATATPANDLAEHRAMEAVFGEHLPSISLYAPKPAVGHALGGAGAVEAVITVLALMHQYVPPTLGVGEVEPKARALDLVRVGRHAPIRHAMSNSFGFGGCNTSLVFGRIS